MSTLFVDATIPMYLVGSAHPNRDRAVVLLERAIRAGDRLVTDAEVLQEVLHRYLAIGRPEAIDPCLSTLRGVVDEIFAVTGDDVLTARALIGALPLLSARDAVHAAVMHRHGVRRILSFDKGFDRLDDIQRIS